MTFPRLIMLVGIPAAGKTTYAKEFVADHPNSVHLSSDCVRAELYGDEAVQGDPNEVFQLLQKRAVEALNDGYTVVYDCTNMTRKDRAGIISACPKFANIEAHIIWAPIEVCIERDAARGRMVGKDVIDRMVKRFQAPWYDEGIREIKTVLPHSFDTVQYTVKCCEGMQIPHDNPHHTEDIYGHCADAHRYIYDLHYSGTVAVAALVHDVGKPYVKAFTDSKGNSCEYAHYYQHQCVGSWMSYGLRWGEPYIAWLISTHMDPYMNTKYYKNLPPFLKRDIDLLHEADLAAH